MASIPLQCICCAKKPKFSDVSHLLTHIGSKGHLSQYYKLKVKSGSDQHARALVDQFDQWYSDWEVEQLMHDRMNLKDKKRPRPRVSGSTRAGSRADSTAPRANSRAGNRPYLGSLDPRLTTDGRVKTEAPVTPQIGAMVPPHVYAPFAAPMYPYQTPYPAYILRSQYAQMQDWTGDAMSESSGLTSLPATTESTFDSTTASQADTEETPLESVEEHAVAECARLKGVLWPGMDLFDSATPEMKRKRNQKKDGSVLEQLEFNSTEVEATEFVWSPLGNLKRVLPITGNPEEEEEDMLSSPTQSLRGTPPSRSVTQSRSPTRPALSEVRTEQFNRSYRRDRPKRTRGPFDTAHNDRVDMQLKYGAGRKRKRFDIFQDEDEVDEDLEEQLPSFPRPIATFSHPAPFNVLTAPYPLHQSYAAAPMSTGYAPFTRANFGSFYATDKENFGPVQPQPMYYQPNFCMPGLPMPQYHHQPQQANNFPNPLWSGQENFFGHQSLENLSPLRLSPLKLEQRQSDDERTITAPHSEV